MATPHTLEDTMRIHDKAVYDWLSGLKVDYGNIAGTQRDNEPILRVIASPQRAFAAVVNILVRTGWIDGNNADQMQQNAGDFAVLPLPIATIQVAPPEQDPELAGVPKKFTKKTFDYSTGKWEEHRWPGHYATDYTVTFWMLKRYTAIYIDEWVRHQLGQVGRGNYETLIPVEHEQPWGTLLQKLELTSSNDRSDLEGKEQRYIRWEYSFRLRTLVMYKPTATHHTIHTTSPTYFDDGRRAGTKENDTQIESRRDSFTGNLFRWFEDKDSIANWPAGGNATIASATGTAPQDSSDPTAPTLSIGLNDEQDRVLLATELSSRNSDDIGVVYYALRYAADGPIAIETTQKDADGSNETTVDRIELDRASTTFERLARLVVVTKPVFSVYVKGRSTLPAPDVLIHNPIVRNLIPQTKRLPTGASKSGSTVTFQWDFLSVHDTYLVVAETDPSASNDTAKVADDASNPTFTQTKTYDASVQEGVVFVASPKDTTLTLTIDGPDPPHVYLQTVPTYAEQSTI